MPDERLALAWKYHLADDYARADLLCREVLKAYPEDPEAWRLLGEVCLFQGRFLEAAEAFRLALQFGPALAEVHNNLGVALARLGSMDRAIPHYREAVGLRPNYVEALNNLGVGLTDLGRPLEAVSLLREALRQKPDYAEAENSLGNALAKGGDVDGAVDAYHRALALRPGYAKAHNNLGITLLLRGDLERGWREYEWRWQCPELPRLPFADRLWDGSPLEGRTILLLAEQGLGDTIQFVRYAARVKERGGHVLVACPASLMGLFASTRGIDRVVDRGGSLPPFETSAPLLNLPTIFETTLATIPAEVPYLHPPASLVAYWRARLRPLDGFRVGIAWQGSVQNRLDHLRSFRLEQFEAIARIPGVRLVSLQVGPGAEQLEEIQGRFSVDAPGRHPDEVPDSFADTASIVKNLDLVISCDSAVAHLAGALAVPVWVTIGRAPDWRWLIDRADSPWYPTMRLFRQTSFGDWSDVFESMAEALRAYVSTVLERRGIAVELEPASLLDRIAALEAEASGTVEPSRLDVLRRDLDRLNSSRKSLLPDSEALSRSSTELRLIHEQLRATLRELRDCDQAGGSDFRLAVLARSILRLHDRRDAELRRIEEVLSP